MGEPDLRDNVLRTLLLDAAATAARSRVDLGAAHGNPLDGVVTRIERAWVADTSTVRQNFVDDLRGAGLGVRDAFDGQHDRLHGDAQRERPRIDVEAEPHLEWKTDRGRIDARVSSRGNY